jgi:catechol 2,3-dioxygenase-like lactoylglutathione lyase family enzyme
MRKPKHPWFETLVRARRIPAPHPPESLSFSIPRLANFPRALTDPDGLKARSIFARVAARPLFGSISNGNRNEEYEWPIEHCATEPERFILPRAGVAAWFASVTLSLLFTLTALAGVRQVESVGITVNDLDREVYFFTNVLAFEEVGRSAAHLETPEKRPLSRVATLKLGDEVITLTEPSTKGRPIPKDSRSYDYWFQHIAIVVRDMDQAYDRLKQKKVKHVSTTPQTLPNWNKAAAGIRAFYFRDPEDHVLEIIWFPKGKGNPKWQEATSRLFLGVDHTAIVVSDTDSSLWFYRDLLGLRVAGESENYGVEQEHLNQVFGAHLRITSLRAERGPGIEFLEYLTPPGGRSLPEDARSNDLVFWQTDLAVDDLPKLVANLEQHHAKHLVAGTGIPEKDDFVAPRQLLLRDPDGHGLQFSEQRPEATASARR